MAESHLQVLKKIEENLESIVERAFAEVNNQRKQMLAEVKKNQEQLEENLMLGIREEFQVLISNLDSPDFSPDLNEIAEIPVTIVASDEEQRTEGGQKQQEEVLLTLSSESQKLKFIFGDCVQGFWAAVRNWDLIANPLVYDTGQFNPYNDEKHVGPDIQLQSDIVEIGTLIEMYSRSRDIENGREITSWIDYRKDLGLLRILMSYSMVKPVKSVLSVISALIHDTGQIEYGGIELCVPGEGNAGDNPVILCLNRLKELESVSNDLISSDDVSEILSLFEKLSEVCSGEGSGNSAIAVKNGGMQLVCYICSKPLTDCEQVLVSTLKTLALLLYDVSSTEIFRSCDGPTILTSILKGGSESVDILSCGFTVLAAAATDNEVLKELFMELKIDELILQVLNSQSKGSVQSVYDAIRVLLTPDDNRVVASQVYGYARRFAKIGIAEALVDSLHGGLTSPSLVSACIALKAVAVNDEICKSIAERGGIDAVLQCINDSGEQGNKTIAKTCCSLICKLAGSDSNKSIIVEKGGLNKLIQLSARCFDDPSVLQEVMPIITVLCLRAPDNAARAIEAGAGELAIQAMQKYPSSQLLQRNSCFMIRNLVARNPENRTILLAQGIEKIVRQAKENHQTCKEAATDALRDLGVDNYNS